MSVDLSTYVPSLRREVTPPGSTLFVGVSDDDMTGYLADAFWEARLDGFMGLWVSDEDGLVTPIALSNGDLPRQDVALIILYAGIKILRNRILNLNTQFRAKAGPVEFEQQNSATMLAEMLKQLKSTKDHLLAAVDNQSTFVSMIDAYSVRVLDYTRGSWGGAAGSYWGSPELTG